MEEVEVEKEEEKEEEEEEEEEDDIQIWYRVWGEGTGTLHCIPFAEPEPGFPKSPKKQCFSWRDLHVLGRGLIETYVMRRPISVIPATIWIHRIEDLPRNWCKESVWGFADFFEAKNPL